MSIDHDASAPAPIPHLGMEERRAQGKAARKDTPRRSVGGWSTPADRPDPIAILEAQAATREPDLVPIRYGRMAASPFAFFRGGPAIMASDLARLPTSGIRVQLCGDAHLVNFGLFGSPERELVFDLNDFDETLPGPWEWDLARLCASVAVAARQNGFSHGDQRRAAMDTARAYREAMLEFATVGTLDLWYLHLNEQRLLEAAADLEREFGVPAPKMAAGRLERIMGKARSANSVAALGKLTEDYEGELRLASRPPLLVPGRELWHGFGSKMLPQLQQVYRAYRASLQDDRRRLLEQFRMLDVARKVVGVGSVGTRCFVVLTQGKGPDDVLLLQVKQAETSVLEPYLGASRYSHHGHRVVAGQRTLQAVSDIFLGWASGPAGLHFYVRQLRDMKGSIDPTKLGPGGMGVYGGLCGWTLARAHGRAGDEVAIAAYLGKSAEADEAFASFAIAYADRNDRDHEALLEAIGQGRVEALADL
jgi:hypothetical protein